MCGSSKWLAEGCEVWITASVKSNKIVYFTIHLLAFLSQTYIITVYSL